MLGLCLQPAWCQTEPTWRVRHRLEGKPDANGGQPHKSTDVSGIACSTNTGFPRTCVVIDDNLQSAQLVIVKEGELVAGSPIPLITDSDQGKPLDLDGEGVAFADGYFYVVGSHGLPRRVGATLDAEQRAKVTARTIASSQIVRFRLEAGSVDSEGRLSAPVQVAQSRKLRDLLRSDPVIGPFVDTRLEENGLTIEGIALRDGRVFIGLRAPVLANGDALVVSVAANVLFGDEPGTIERHLLHLGPGQGVRDLAAVEGGMLVLAGPWGEAEGPYSVHHWDGRTRLRLLKQLAAYQEKKRVLKPEAILPLDESAESQRVLILFDGAEEGGPRPIEVAK